MVFRRNTAATRMVSSYFRIVGHDFLVAVIGTPRSPGRSVVPCLGPAPLVLTPTQTVSSTGPSVQDACNSAPLQNVNLRGSGDGDPDNEQALLALIEVCRNVCDMVLQNIIRFPSILRSLIQSVYKEVRRLASSEAVPGAAAPRFGLAFCSSHGRSAAPFVDTGGATLSRQRRRGHPVLCFSAALVSCAGEPVSLPLAGKGMGNSHAARPRPLTVCLSVYLSLSLYLSPPCSQPTSVLLSSQDSEPEQVHAQTLIMMARLMQSLVNFTGGTYTCAPWP